MATYLNLSYLYILQTLLPPVLGQTEDPKHLATFGPNVCLFKSEWDFVDPFTPRWTATSASKIVYFRNSKHFLETNVLKTIQHVSGFSTILENA